MLTRLQVSGFKNLVDVDVRFGPFTCLAGPNGAGKSNLFDAIRFLSALADRPLQEAALAVRDADARTGDGRGLFFRQGDSAAEVMRFEAEMIVPAVVRDGLGQEARATITFLRYTLELGWRAGEGRGPGGNATGAGLEVRHESLAHINRGEAHRHLLFPHSAKHWRQTAVLGERRGVPFISTDGEGRQRTIRLHRDVGGHPLSRLAADLPRTVLSAANAAESPTVLAARRELQSWQLLRLEPAALRLPDHLFAPATLGRDGAHLPATLYRLAMLAPAIGGYEHGGQAPAAPAYTRVAARLTHLLGDGVHVRVERDERRELLTLLVGDRHRTLHPARALSDGTLRFLALAVLEQDPDAGGLLCLEEPENGIYPERLPVLIDLLQALATDVGQPVGHGNPLRQLIVATHSPAIVQQVPDDCLLVVQAGDAVPGGHAAGGARCRHLGGTWRDQGEPRPPALAKTELLAFLNPVAPAAPVTAAPPGAASEPLARTARTRLIDRPDLQPLLPQFGPAAADDRPPTPAPPPAPPGEPA